MKLIKTAVSATAALALTGGGLAVAAAPSAASAPTIVASHVATASHAQAHKHHVKLSAKAKRTAKNRVKLRIKTNGKRIVVTYRSGGHTHRIRVTRHTSVVSRILPSSTRTIVVKASKTGSTSRKIVVPVPKRGNGSAGSDGGMRDVTPPATESPETPGDPFGGSGPHITPPVQPSTLTADAFAAAAWTTIQNARASGFSCGSSGMPAVTRLTRVTALDDSASQVVSLGYDDPVNPWDRAWANGLNHTLSAYSITLPAVDPADFLALLGAPQNREVCQDLMAPANTEGGIAVTPVGPLSRTVTIFYARTE